MQVRHDSMRCPKCRHYNALILETYRPLSYRCRDCGAVVNESERVAEEARK